MRAVVQRMSGAPVCVDGIKIAEIGKGLLALVGVARQDSRPDRDWMAKKIVELRIVDNSQGKLNLSLKDVGGQLLLAMVAQLFCRQELLYPLIQSGN